MATKVFKGAAAHEIAAAASVKPDPVYDAGRQAALAIIHSGALGDDGDDPAGFAYDVEIKGGARKVTVVVTRGQAFEQLAEEA